MSNTAKKSFTSQFQESPGKVMQCPKCGFEQPQSQECMQCGIILAKYHALQAKKRKTPPPKSVKESPRTPSAIPNAKPRQGADKIPGHLKLVFGVLEALQARLISALPENMVPHFSRVLRAIRVYHANLKEGCTAYGKKVLDALLDIVLFMIISLVLNSLALLLMKMMWTVYSATEIGAMFTQLSEQLSARLTLVLQHNMFFPLEISLAAFVICFLVSLPCRFLHISRFVYDYRNTGGKILLCGLPLTYLVSQYVINRFGFDATSAYCVAVMPTFCIFPTCFHVSSSLFPEVGTILKRIWEILKSVWQRRLAGKVNGLKHKIRALIKGKASS